MNRTTRNLDESRLANEIVSVFDPAALRTCSSDRDTIRYAVRDRSLKLRTIVLGRQALRRLLVDPACAVKVEYLQRELLRCAGQRSEFSYPPSVARAKSEPAAQAEAAAI